MGEVRAQALRGVLERCIGRATEIGKLRRLSGGANQETWSFDAQIAGASLPLILRSYPAYHQLSDAPDTCPGLAVEVGGHLYREDFDHTNDNDWYRFTAQAGLAYDIRTFDLEAGADTVLTLYDTDCTTPLAQNDDVEPNNVASRIKWQASTAGEYHVNVRHYNWTVYGTDTAYTLQVTR